VATVIRVCMMPGPLRWVASRMMVADTWRNSIDTSLAGFAFCICTSEVIDDDQERIDSSASRDTCRAVSCESKGRMPSAQPHFWPNKAMPTASEAASIVPFGAQLH
jgi:hypothetical protein